MNNETILNFLNRIGERKRHSLAFIHPAKEGLQGSTYEVLQIPYMMKEIQLKQTVGYGVYYSLNEGCHISKQRGYSGKLLANEIIKIHMFGFDIDYITGNLEQREQFEKRASELVLDNPVKPNLIISTGGGFQVLFILISPLNVAMSNAKIPTEIEAKSDLVAQMIRDEYSQLYGDIVAMLATCLKEMVIEGLIKIDRLSNIDRVFRLPGTLNFPTQAKIEKGATVRLAKIVFDNGDYWDYHELREVVPRITAPVDRKPKTEFVENPNAKWTPYKKAKYLCEYIRDNKLVDDNQNYTNDLMFPLFGMINRNEISAVEGRELWLMATSTGRETAYGNYETKWDKRKIANYVHRDLGSLIFYCRTHECLIPWSGKDIEKQIEAEARAITAENMRNPVIADESELLDW